MSKETLSLNLSIFISLGSNLAGQFLMYLGVIVLARTFNPSEFGEFRYLFTVCTIINLFVLFGRDSFMVLTRQAVVKFDVAYTNELFSGIINILVVLSLTIALGFFLGYQNFSGQLEKYFVCMLMVCFWGVANLLIAVLKVENKVLRTQVLSNFVQRFLRLLCFLAVAYLYSSDVINAYYAMLLSQVIFALVLLSSLSIGTLRLIIKAKFRDISYKHNFSKSAGLFVITIVSVLALKVDILVLGLIDEWEKVAIYEIVIMISTVVLLPQMASQKVTELNYISTAYNNKLRSDAVDKAIKYSMIPLLIITVFPVQILNVFGADYISGAGVLVLISMGYYVSIFFGSPFETLMMNGHANIGARILSFQVAFTILLILLLHKIIGLYGVLLAIIICLSVGKIIGRKFCKRQGLFVNKINYKLLVVSVFGFSLISIPTLIG